MKSKISRKNFDDNFKYLNENNSKKNKLVNKLFGDKAFIILMFSLFIPSALQQLITIAVTYVDIFFISGFAPNKITIDNNVIDIANPGTIAKTAVGISTSVINFPLMVTLGVTSGIGLVTAQYYGAKQKNELQQTIIYKILVSLLLVTPFIILMMVMPFEIISVSRNVFNPVLTSESGLISSVAATYLFWSAPGFFIIILVYTLGYSYREIGKPKYALIASLCSMCVNIIMDPLLIIFEKDLNNAVRNIALATICSRFIEFLVMFIFIYAKKEYYLFIKKVKLDFKTFKVTIKNSWQAIFNDALYGFATLFLVMCLLIYDENSHDAFTTVSIIIQFANVIFPGMAASCAVLVGSELGNNNIEKAKSNSICLITWGSIITLVFALILFALSWFINPILSPPPPIENSNLYNQWLANQELAKQAEWVMMPIIFSQGIFSILYFSIKAGGSKYIFFTDGFVMSVWCVVLGCLLYTKTINPNNLKSPLLLFFIVEFNQIAKAITSFIMYKWSNWAINITINK
ncbi:MATE family efflux transporter [Malacoplasma iowae]|uniref:MATE family efflux transporter n=1 Tax=Malacoplasma iowae TaxID=2116 RepID=UPI002A186AD5|nr:MATE family efflux transporter [Malacoplasma iowae]WPL40195.1 MATE family efflux transporter [Malacoplasma iowae]